jgi:hypothetical protein
MHKVTRKIEEGSMYFRECIKNNIPSIVVIPKTQYAIIDGNADSCRKNYSGNMDKQWLWQQQEELYQRYKQYIKKYTDFFIGGELPYITVRLDQAEQFAEELFQILDTYAKGMCPEKERGKEK